MSATIDYAPHYGAVPHRKALVPSGSYPSGVTGNDQMYTRQPSHGHSRSVSSSTMPAAYPTQTQAYNTNNTYNPALQQSGMTARRTLSNATSSTASSSAPHPVARAPTNSTFGGSIRRSTSSRSQQQPATSYVALLRRQKATVWCDHAQHEDPRVLAQQRQAKARATMAVVGGASSAMRNSTSSGGGVRSKIRHHGAVKASAFMSGNMAGAGVPMRLSASEVDDEDSDDDRLKNTRYHQRNSSGRSSLSSGQRINSLGLGGNVTTASGSSLVGTGRLSEGSTPPSGPSHSPSINSLGHNADETPVPRRTSQDYFGRPGMGVPANSGGSGSSEEMSYGGLTSLPDRSRQEDQKRKTSDELRRRGSVDDRTMTMSAVRLFVANPDLSD